VCKARFYLNRKVIQTTLQFPELTDITVLTGFCVIWKLYQQHLYLLPSDCRRCWTEAAYCKFLGNFSIWSWFSVVNDLERRLC